MNTLDFEDLDKYLLAQRGHIIHQVWFTNIQNKKNTTKMYKKYKKYKDSWQIKNPTWCQVEWNQHQSKKLMQVFFPVYYNMYKNYIYEIQRCDCIRYFFLYRYGGLYADMDYYCNKSFDQALSIFKNSFYLVSTPNVGNSYVSNSLMYSKPRHPFWRRLFFEMNVSKSCPIYYSRHLIVMYTTGPGILTRVYNKYKIKYRLKSLPSHLFHPHGLSDNIMTLNNDKVYSIHIGEGSWEHSDSKILTYFYIEWKIILFIILVIFIPNLFFGYRRKSMYKNR